MFKKKLFFAISSLALLQACTTFDPYTGEEKVSKTAVGAGIGAGLGAVLAYAQNKDETDTVRRQRMMKAAAAGAALGGSAGLYMDNQEAKLRKQLRSSGVSVERDGEIINLIMPGNITFATGSPDINSSFYQVLDSVILVLKEFDKTIVVVAGHTDNSGSESSNQVLSRKRAESVSNYFRSKGVLPGRLDAVGFGESQPIVSNATKAGREKNRRVEITLQPIPDNS